MVFNQGFTYKPHLFLSSPPQDITNFWLNRSYFLFIFGFPLPWCLVQSTHSMNTFCTLNQFFLPPSILSETSLLREAVFQMLLHFAKKDQIPGQMLTGRPCHLETDSQSLITFSRISVKQSISKQDLWAGAAASPSNSLETQNLKAPLQTLWIRNSWVESNNMCVSKFSKSYRCSLKSDTL